MPSAEGRAALPVTPDRIARLRGFGLSEYAARAYLALLHLGTCEARDVASISKVPASKIYHILDQLHEKGLAVILPEFPRKYAPVPFADYLQRIHDEHEAAAQLIRGERDALAEMFAVIGDQPAAERGSVTLLRGRRNVRERALELLAGASADVLLLTTKQQADDPRAWAEPIASATARGVRVRVLGAALGSEWRARPAGLANASFVVLVDGRIALLGNATPDDGHPTEGHDAGLHVDQEGIVALLASVLEAMWSMAVAPRPVPVGAPPPRPEGLMR